MSEETESKKKAYEEKLEAEMNEISAKIDVLKAKAAKAKSAGKADYYETIEDLEEKKEVVRSKMNQLKDSGSDAWEEIKAGTEKAWSDLSDSVQSAISKFK